MLFGIFGKGTLALNEFAHNTNHGTWQQLSHMFLMHRCTITLSPLPNFPFALSSISQQSFLFQIINKIMCGNLYAKAASFENLVVRHVCSQSTNASCTVIQLQLPLLGQQFPALVTFFATPPHQPQAFDEIYVTWSTLRTKTPIHVDAGMKFCFQLFFI